MKEERGRGASSPEERLAAYGRPLPDWRVDDEVQTDRDTQGTCVSPWKRFVSNRTRAFLAQSSNTTEPRSSWESGT